MSESVGKRMCFRVGKCLERAWDGMEGGVRR